MRAAVTNPDPAGPAVLVQDLPRPRPRPGWVVIELRAAALNRLDAMILAGRDQEPPGTVLGSDGAGVVVEHGPDQPADVLPVGSEVVISPSLYWDEGPVPGPDYEILGSPTPGTHAQLVTVPAGNVHPRPAHLTWQQAAALPLAGLTAWRALVTRGRLRRGETVVVGAASSGVGSAAIQIASHEGARVVALTSSAAHGRHALALGADAVVDRTTPGFADKLVRASGGAQLALDPTGALWQTFVDALAPAGRLVVVGRMAADAAALRVQSVYWKQVDVLGSSMGSTADLRALLAHVTAHGWAPSIDSVHDLDDIEVAYRRLDSPERRGKVVLQLAGG